MEIRTVLAVLVLAAVGMAVPMQEHTTDLQPEQSTWESDHGELESAVNLLQSTVNTEASNVADHRAAIKLLVAEMAAAQAKAATAGKVHAQAVKLARTEADELTQKHSVSTVKLKLVQQKAEKARLVIAEVEVNAGKLDSKAAKRWRKEWVNPVSKEAKKAAKIAQKNLEELDRKKRKMERAARLAKAKNKDSASKQRRKLRRAGRKLRRDGRAIGDKAIHKLREGEKQIKRMKAEADAEIKAEKKLASKQIKKEAKAVMADLQVRMNEKLAGVAKKSKPKTAHENKVDAAVEKHMKAKGENNVADIVKKVVSPNKVDAAVEKHMKAKGENNVADIVKKVVSPPKSTVEKAGQAKESKVDKALELSLKKNHKQLKALASGKKVPESASSDKVSKALKKSIKNNEKTIKALSSGKAPA